MIVKKTQKNSSIYICKLCDFISCNNNDYNRHISTVKHKNRQNGSVLVVNDSQITQKNSKFYHCDCGKIYKYDSGYYRHKKNCNLHILEEFCEIIKEKDDSIDKELIMMLVKQNSELLEVIKNGTHNNIHNNTNNSNNKSFNLQFFLNETCKDAMNIMDFVDSIKLQLSDLENVGKLGSFA
jgi:uncharacterized C2H2 Zn-finger protein